MNIHFQKENKVVFPAGSLKSAPEKDAQNKQKKWPVGGNIDPNVVYIPGKFVIVNNYS